MRLCEKCPQHQVVVLHGTTPQVHQALAHVAQAGMTVHLALVRQVLGVAQALVILAQVILAQVQIGKL